MGGKSSKPAATKKNVKNPVELNWETIRNGELYNIVRNKTDGTLAEEYQYTLDNRYDPCVEADIYHRRSKASLPIVRSLEHQWQAKGTGLVPKNNFRVVTESLPHRLTNAPQLTIDQSLYVLDRALQGYNFLYHNVGPFDINSNMIGITQQGQVKVWHNQNFGRNYPYHQKRTLQSTKIDRSHLYDNDEPAFEQTQMVRNIVNVVQDRCQQGQFHQPFRSQIRQEGVGFLQARKLIFDQYQDPQRVRLNRIDLKRNLVKSKISKVHGNTVYGSTVHQPLASKVAVNLSRLDNQPQFNTVYLKSSFLTPGSVYDGPRIQPTESQIIRNPSSIVERVPSGNYETASTYQTTYGGNTSSKNAYSFSFKKPVNA